MTTSSAASSSSPLRDGIRAVEQASSATDLLLATRALADLLAPSASGAAADQPLDAPDRLEAIGSLVTVLGFNNPGAAVAAVDGLIRCGGTAVEPLLNRLDPRNYGARAWAVRALAGIGDVRGLQLLEEALAEDVGPSVRRAAAAGLGNLKIGDLEISQQASIRGQALAALLAGCGDGEWVVRYAVVVGLEALVQQMQPSPEERSQALEALKGLELSGQEETPVVQLRASLAIARLATSQTPSERETP